MIVDKKELTIIGETNFRNMRKKFGIKRDDRRRHVYVIGKSGSGKSALLENMIMQDILNGNGCCVMDPHGDLAEAIVKCIPPERQKDIVYFNPSDTEFPIAFNILEGAGSDSSKNLVASGLIGIFKKIWADSWGPRLEYVLRNTILSLMYADGSTLLGINRMLVDKKYRNSVLEKVSDPIIKNFWYQEYENYPAKELPTIISPIQNKVGQFLSNPIVRNILGQSHSTIDLREIMDNKKIFLVNLSKGRIGEDNSSLIGSMLVTKIYLAAMSRVDIPEDQRNDFYLYVDEFQNFATDSFADILSEARKYRLALTIAHQYILQLPEKVSDAIFGNGGTLITFRLGPQDAEVFEKEFGPDFVLEDLVNIPKYNIVLKLLIDGVTSKPFSAATIAPMTKTCGIEDRSSYIIQESRKKYARTKELVEEEIKAWSEEGANSINGNKNNQNNQEKIIKKEEQKGPEEEKPKFTTNCWVCGMKMEVPFEPDNKRPIYCVDCLKKVRENLIPEPKNNRFIKPEGKKKNKEKDNSQQNNQNNNSNNKNTEDNVSNNTVLNEVETKNQNNQSKKPIEKKDKKKKQQNKSQENNQNNNSNIEDIKKTTIVEEKIKETNIVNKDFSNDTLNNQKEYSENKDNDQKEENNNAEQAFKEVLSEIMKESGIEKKENNQILNQVEQNIKLDSIKSEPIKLEEQKETIPLESSSENKKLDFITAPILLQNSTEQVLLDNKKENDEITNNIENIVEINEGSIEEKINNEYFKEESNKNKDSEISFLSLEELKNKSYKELKNDLNKKENNKKILEEGRVVKL